MTVSVSFRNFDIRATVARAGVAVWTKFSISVRRLELRIAESVFGGEEYGVSSYLVDRLAVGLGNKHDCDLSADDGGDVFGSEDRDSRRGGQSLSRWGGMISLGRGLDARSPVVRPFSSVSPLIFSTGGTALQNSVYCGKIGGS